MTMVKMRTVDGNLEEALAFACLMTIANTWRLGTLSAICGGANAAGTCIPSALVLQGGGEAPQVGFIVSNMVGNVAGMICDGGMSHRATKAFLLA